MEVSEFAELLSELKERSGLSYGMLAKRLHMSTSTLHRYCNGDAVPAEYGPVERFARLCKASPEELVELHRRWVLADVTRGQKNGGGSGSAAVSSPPAVSEVEVEVGAPAVSEAVEPSGVRAPAPDASAGDAPASPPRRRSRHLLLAGVTGVALLGAASLIAVNLSSGGSEDDGGRQAAGAAAAVRERVSEAASPSVSSSGAGSSAPVPSSESSGSGSASAPPSSRPSVAQDDAPAPLTVTTRPYAWDTPCSAHYLIDREPGLVAPPSTEQDAPGWVAAHQAVSSGEQFLELTVQGTGKETVVVDGVTVRSAAKRSPLAWNDYAMAYPGVGCGGGVPTRYFTVALDAARPALVPEAGHKDFPFKVSESDPEVYYVRADATAYYVSWYLELSWSSGSRHGTVTIDDHGRPFRTSGRNGRPAYEFPLGGDGWVPAGTTSQ